MKKTLSIGIVIALILSTTMPAIAEDVGIRFKIPFGKKAPIAMSMFSGSTLKSGQHQFSAQGNYVETPLAKFSEGKVLLFGQDQPISNLTGTQIVVGVVLTGAVVLGIVALTDDDDDDPAPLPAGGSGGNL